MDASNETEARHRLAELVREFDTAMLVTRGMDASLRGRPMAVAQVLGDADVWFVTTMTSPKVDELLADPHVLVVMQKGQSYLCVSGYGEIHRDHEKVRELWSETWRLWFRGPEDPELVLIRVRPSDAEYWDNSGASGIRFALLAAKAYFTGDSLKDPEDVQVHAKVPL